MFHEKEKKPDIGTGARFSSKLYFVFKSNFSTASPLLSLLRCPPSRLTRVPRGGLKCALLFKLSGGCKFSLCCTAAGNVSYERRLIVTVV